MPKRSYSAAGSYRYGFNGKENDNDVKGLGNQQDYGMRIYDARVGRFLSEDPLFKSFPKLSPYQFAENKPINSIDLDGLEASLAIYTYAKDNAGIEHITYVEIPLEQHQQRPEFGNKGTLTKYYIYNERTSKTDYYEVYEHKIQVQKKGFLNRLFGNKEWLPQIQVFGSGTEPMGDKVDPSKPLFSFNLYGDELFELLTLGRTGPEKYGPMSEVDKYEEAVNGVSKWREAIEKIKQLGSSNSKANETKPDPVVIEEEREGTWEYYYKDKNGGLTTERKLAEPPVIFPGSNGAPDTIKKVKYKEPKPPKKEIPRKD